LLETLGTVMPSDARGAERGQRAEHGQHAEHDRR
jgi:hypothetical protein